MENQSTSPVIKKYYQVPVLKAFGKIGEVTMHNGWPNGFINDGGGDTLYTS